MKAFPSTYLAPNGVEKPLAEHLLLVALSKATESKELGALISKQGFTIAQGGRELGGSGRINQSPTRYFVQSKEALSDESVDALRKALGDRLAWIAPVYGDPAAAVTLVAPLPHVLILDENPSNEKLLFAAGKEYKVSLEKERSNSLVQFNVYQVESSTERNAYGLRALLLEKGADPAEVLLENQPFLSPTCASPNDPIYPTQWHLQRVQAECAWNKTKGSPGVVVAVIDEGCDLTHPDLVANYVPSSFGVNETWFGRHGTACAGIVGATYNNALGVAGLAGQTGILSRAATGWTDLSVATDIFYSAFVGCKVISMSFGVYDHWGIWNYAMIDVQINYAHNIKGVVLVAASGNENDGTKNRYPGKHPLVMCVGGSDQLDKRKSPSSPTEPWWGANYGTDTYLGIKTGLSVVAPCVSIPTTDIQGGAGYSCNGYFAAFNGTSSATPQVAALAALIRTQYPGLTNVQVRHIIERTAEKVGGYTYAANPHFPTSSWYQEMGYGRINACRALNHAEVMIRDYPSDTGAESTAGDVWSSSDIVVRAQDDNNFVPDNYSMSSYVERGQHNFIYIRVKNNGPAPAVNVFVSCRVVAAGSVSFTFPQDWILINSTHVAPQPMLSFFALINPGEEKIAKFRITAAQTQQLYGWQVNNAWHPCILARVHASNDYSFSTAGLLPGQAVYQRNNFAQKNLTVVDLLLSAPGPIRFPFVAGNRFLKQGRIHLVVEAKDFPEGTRPRLRLDGNQELFPLMDFRGDQGQDKHIEFEEDTRIRMVDGHCDLELLLAKGSRARLAKPSRVEPVEICGGCLVIEEGIRYVELQGERLELGLEIKPGSVHALAVQFDKPEQQLDRELIINAFQRDGEGRISGGVTAVYKA